MSVDKHKGLNTCLCLLRKNLNNFTELSASDLPSHESNTNHKSNTKYYESTSGLVLSLPASLPYLFKIACPEQFELCLSAFRRVKDNWTQPTEEN